MRPTLPSSLSDRGGEVLVKKDHLSAYIWSGFTYPWQLGSRPALEMKIVTGHQVSLMHSHNPDGAILPVSLFSLLWFLPSSCLGQGEQALQRTFNMMCHLRQTICLKRLLLFTVTGFAESQVDCFLFFTRQLSSSTKTLYYVSRTCWRSKEGSREMFLIFIALEVVLSLADWCFSSLDHLSSVWHVFCEVLTSLTNLFVGWKRIEFHNITSSFLNVNMIKQTLERSV